MSTRDGGASRGSSGRSGSTGGRWPAWVRYLLYFLLVAGLVTHLSGRRGGPAEGQPAVAFTLPRVNGSGTIQLSDYHGEPLLIEVFASWCGSCRQAAPMVASLASQHRDRVGFVGVSVDETAEQARVAARQWGIDYPVALDDGSFSRAYDVSAVPTFLLIDAQGLVARVVHGVPRRGQLHAWLEELAKTR